MGMHPPAPWRFFHLAVWHKPLALARCWYSIAPHWEPVFIYVKGKKPWRSFRNADVFPDVFQASVQTIRRGHPTEKPEALWGPLLRFGCPPAAIVLDPFSGSGTTAAVAKRLHMQAVLVDNNPAYLEMTRGRIGPQAVLL
jgi:DNA modification methylase